MYGESPSALVKCHPPMHHGALTWVLDTVWFLSSSTLVRALLTQSRDFFFLVVSLLWALPRDVSVDAGGCTFLRDSPSSVPAGSGETWQGLWSSEVGLFVHSHAGG